MGSLYFEMRKKMIEMIETIYDEPSDRRILDRDDWTDSEWKTILEIFGIEEADRIVVRKYSVEKHIMNEVKA